ncbi:hypothetical protein SAVCW2_13630 [Streptomyces avermitilis]|nr:hypothetical protein SAVCW2_13630 [Streptomyces avermitilis]
MLIDTYGRVATDLRVSLTDRCNLRCTYCMPEEGLQWLAKPDLLTDDEIVRLIDIAVTRLGITEVRFTGGEPLLRPGLVGIVERVAALASRPQTSLTTNGIGLSRTATALKAAGLDRVNVSLDTLRPDVFKTLTRRDRHKDVIAGLEAARDAGLTPVKVNTVLMPGLNADEAPTCWPGPWRTTTSCVSSSRCPWTPSTAGSARAWSPRATSSPRCVRVSSSRRRAPTSAAPPRPSAGSSTAARTAWA